MGHDDGSGLTNLIDRIAIEDLIYRYSDAVTRADWDQCEGTFATDAVWESPALGIRYEGARAFRDFLAQTTTSDILIQTPHAPVIRLLDHESAQCTTTIYEFVRAISLADTPLAKTGDEQNLEQWGLYYDDIGKVDGHWVFTHRLYVPMYAGPGVVTGEVLTPRGDLHRPQRQIERPA